MDDDGFFMGEIEGQRGLVPSNFLADIPPGMDTKTLLYQVIQISNNADENIICAPKIRNVKMLNCQYCENNISALKM